jgi:hypothetical protein
MTDVWDFSWTGPGITNVIGGAILKKNNKSVTLTPRSVNSRLKKFSWEMDIVQSPNVPFFSGTSVNDVSGGVYTPDKNYFFPVVVQSANGPITNTFYIYLGTDGKISGLFVPDDAILRLPPEERQLFTLFWDKYQLPNNTDFSNTLNGENESNKWYVLTSLSDAIITLPLNMVQYTAADVTPRPKTTSTPTSTSNTQKACPTHKAMTCPPQGTAPPLTPNLVLYNRLVNENNQINDYIAMLMTQQSTDMQKIQYQTPRITTLSTVSTVLFYAYFILLFIFCYYLFMENASLSIGLKIAIVLLFLIYPLIVYFFESTAWTYTVKTRDFIFGRPIGNDPIQRNTTDMVQNPYSEEPSSLYPN